MARAYSQDLRDRVIRTALGGVAVRQAAARYGVGVSTAILWVRRARSGEVTARRQGQPKGSKLDAHAAFLLELIEASSHISLQEMQAKLREECGVSAGIGTLWRFFKARAITVKKNRPRLRARPARRQSRARSLVRRATGS
jgi:transposase